MVSLHGIELMRIVQIVLSGASEFEKKCQRVDFAALSERHDVTVTDSTSRVQGADIAHVYGPSPLPARPLAGFAVRYVASSAPPRHPLALRQPAAPRVILSPDEVPEAVEEVYFASRARESAGNVVGTFSRPGIVNIVELTIARIGRFRDDITWNLFDRVPTPHDLAGVDVWVDPAVDETDFDGFVAEAIASGKSVAASRTRMNSQRLEKGRTGFLVPRNDPNELAHAILAALFKPEVARSKLDAARQTAGKFRPRQRLRILERIYETMIE